MATPAKSNLTPADIEALKEKHGEIYRLSVAPAPAKYDPYLVPGDDDEIADPIVAYVRKPTNKEISHAMTKMPAMLEAGKVIVKSCFVGGDERILTEAPLFNAGAMQALEILEFHRAKLVKL